MEPLSPLLKWPGGKRSLLKHILPLVPQAFDRYFEPFLGGGALFFALGPEQATLSDSNDDLMNCYIQVRDNADQVIAQLRRLKNTKHDYYENRKRFPRGKAAGAARLIYLTTLSFNGIYRLNRRGQFNVPYGRKSYLEPCDPAKILLASEALATADLRRQDFEPAVAGARRGDLVYFDPPYTVAHANNGFLKYNAKIFSWSDQVRLAGVARELAKRGCKVIISNAYHPSVLKLYDGFRRHEIQRTSIIAASGTFRRKTMECVFYNEA